jgi:ribonuclease III
MIQLDIKLQEVKEEIDINGFKRDDLLRIALTDLSDLSHPNISQSERESIEKSYRRLAFLGDSLFNSVLANYLFDTNRYLTRKNLDDWRQKIATRKSFTEFAIDLGLPEYSSSWNKKTRKPPMEEPAVWGEMFEAVIGVIFIDRDRSFITLSMWLVNRFIRPKIGSEVGDTYSEDLHYTEQEYFEMCGFKD